MTRLAIEGTSDEDIDQWCIARLKGRGYGMARLDNWETPKEVCKRLKVSSAHLSSTLRDRKCPLPIDVIRGPTGRVNYLVSHPALDAFITKHDPTRRTSKLIAQVEEDHALGRIK